MTTLAPAFDKASAVSRPMPWEAPVTMATLSFRLNNAFRFIHSLGRPETHPQKTEGGAPKTEPTKQRRSVRRLLYPSWRLNSFRLPRLAWLRSARSGAANRIARGRDLFPRRCLRLRRSSGARIPPSARAWTPGGSARRALRRRWFPCQHRRWLPAERADPRKAPSLIRPPVFPARGSSVRCEMARLRAALPRVWRRAVKRSPLRVLRRRHGRK